MSDILVALEDFSILVQTNFKDGKGKVYMTHPTKALHKFMMQDFVRMGYVPFGASTHFKQYSSCTS